MTEAEKMREKCKQAVQKQKTLYEESQGQTNRACASALGFALEAIRAIELPAEPQGVTERQIEERARNIADQMYGAGTPQHLSFVGGVLWAYRQFALGQSQPRNVAGEEKITEDVRVGSVVFRKGVNVSTVLLAARRAFQHEPEVPDECHPHLIGGEFQSDKYPTTPRGKVPLSVKDKTAQDLLWEYAQRRRSVDAAFAEDLEIALALQGYTPPLPNPPKSLREQAEESVIAYRGSRDAPGFEACVEAEMRILTNPPAAEVTLADWEKLRDPTTLHVNLLRGFPAKLSREQLLHLAGDPPAAPSAEDKIRAGLNEAIAYAKGETEGVRTTVYVPAAPSDDEVRQLRERLKQYVNTRFPKDCRVGSFVWLNGLMAIILAALPRPAVSGWRMLESAPRDGTHILSFTPDMDECDPKQIIIAWSTRDREWFTPDGKNNESWKGATHWQPLPEPPLAASPTAQEGNDGAT